MQLQTQQQIAAQSAQQLAVTDLRLGMRRNRYQVDAPVTNLTDGHANLADAVLIGAELPKQPRFLINQPRTVGIETRIRFQ